MKAIVIGGTGATGRELVNKLLEDTRFSSVVVLSRRSYFKSHLKLKEVIVDFENLEKHRTSIQGEVAFSCLGTTLKDAGSKEAQWRVDHDYQLSFAKLAYENGVKNFVLLSSFGARKVSSIFYSQMKGTLEENMKEIDFEKLIILQPGSIERPHSTRFFEKLSTKILKGFNTIGLLKKMAPILTSDLAQAMIKAHFMCQERQTTINLKGIREILK